MVETRLNEKQHILPIPIRVGLMIAFLFVALLLMPVLVAHAETITVDDACDLYEAIENANNGDQTNSDCASGSAGHDTIVFDLTYPATLALTAGQLEIVDDLTITGPGESNLAISGNNASRVISTTGSVTITGVTIRNGNVNGSGGGIFNRGTLVLADCTVSNNTVTGVDNDGAGIHNEVGTLTVNGCTISNNTVQAGADDGGGIHTFSGTLTIDNSYIFGNVAADDGGGVRGNYATTITVRNTTIYNNTAGDNGGGFRIYNPDSRATIENSTISGNTATGTDGGGIYVSLAVVTVTNSTIADNSANTGGGGVFVLADGAIVTLVNTIVAGNTSTAGGPDVAGTVNSLDYNLVEDTTGATFSGTTTNNITGQDPLLGALADNGGDTSTHALLVGSPAVNHIPLGTNGCGVTMVADQRGVSRPQGVACDIGAYEAQAALALTKAVDDDSPGPGELVTYSIVVANSGALTATDALVSDPLPGGLTFAGPVTLQGTTGTVAQDENDLPVLASDMSISAGGRITVTFPVTVNVGLAGGTVITNVASVTSTEVVLPQTAAEPLTVQNVAPMAVDDTDAVTENSGTTSIDVLDNDDDLNGDVISITSVGVPDSGGTASENQGMIDYTPMTSFAGTEVFTYTISDGELTDTATVTITVTAAPALSVIKSVVGAGGQTANLQLGSIVTYTLTLTNSGSEVANGVVMTDKLPLGVSFGGWIDQGSAQLAPPDDTITWGPDAVPARTSYNIRFTATVTSNVDFGGSLINNTAWYRSTDAGSGSDSASFTIFSGGLYLPIILVFSNG